MRIDVIGVLVGDPTKLGWRAEMRETCQRSVREKWDREKLKRWRRWESKQGWRVEMGKCIREVCEGNGNVGSWKYGECGRRSWVEELKLRKCIREVCEGNGNVKSWKDGEGGRRALIWWETCHQQSNGFIDVSYLIQCFLRCRKRNRFDEVYVLNVPFNSASFIQQIYLFRAFLVASQF
jgi:hypothetical protein